MARERLFRHDVHTIKHAGVFDLEWYQAQAGRVFASEPDAIADYLRRPRDRYLSPHPLFEPDYFDSGFRRREMDPLLHFLRHPARLGLAPHPVLEVRMKRALRRPGVTSTEAWLQIVQTLAPNVRLPWLGAAPRSATGRAPTWGRLRQDLLRSARRWRADERLSRAPRSQPVAPKAPVDGGSRQRKRPDAEPSPLVSVVMPTWNRAAKLRGAIQSLQDQTYRNWELVIVDDGSTDDTRFVLEGACAFDERIRVIHQERGGVCRARNVALAASTGTYVAFLDSDNTWTPGFLEAMVGALTEQQASVAHAVLRVETPKGTYFRAFAGTVKHLLVANHIDLNVLVAERHLLDEIGGFDESLKRAVDYDLVIRLARRASMLLVPEVGAVYRDDPEDNSRISVTEPLTWNAVVRERHMVDWEAVAARTTTTARTSVVLPFQRNVEAVLGWVAALRIAAAEGHDVELVLVAAGANRVDTVISRAAASYLPRARVLHTPRDVGVPLAANLATQHVTGDTVVYVRAEVLPAEGWLAPLLTALQRDGVAAAQAVVLRANGIVDNAGAVFADREALPQALLATLPLNDAVKLDGSTLPAAHAGVVACHRSVVVALQGLDPLVGNSMPEADLSLRARERGLGRTVLAAGSRAVCQPVDRPDFTPDLPLASQVLNNRWSVLPDGSEELWRRAGLSVVGVRQLALGKDGSPPFAVRSVVGRARRLERVHEHPPRLRWTIDTAAPSGSKGERWGDTHFARSLARSLREAGQDVAVDVRTARSRATRDLDDVLLVLRGLDHVRPRRTTVSLQWIISHPELVSEPEVAAYDAVFAASSTWARHRSHEWGLPIATLLQCTDPMLFNPDLAVPDTGHEVLFVGNSRKVDRAAVRVALEAGLDVAIYGREWEGRVEPQHVVDTWVSNDQLGALYAGAGIVLNDHWDGMRHDGFLSNRLFDAVACGARVITDDIEGVTDIFGDQVQVFTSAADMGSLVRERLTRFPDATQRRASAKRILEEHSFDRRAEQLIDAATRAWRRSSSRSDAPIRRSDA